MTLEEYSAEMMVSVLATDYATTTYPTIIPTTTSPGGGAGVISFGDGGSVACRNLLLVPYGTGSPTNTFLMKIYGWRKFRNTAKNPSVALWIPTQIFEFEATLGNSTGVAGSDLAATYNFADAVALPGTSSTGVTINPATDIAISPNWFGTTMELNTDVAWCMVPSFGFRYLQVVFATAATGGTPVTNCNAMWCKAGG
jgi:hypothetical protein